MSRGSWSRLDPQDWGPAYRCLIGIPGGVNGALYPLIVAANNDYTDGQVRLQAGRGRGDTVDEGVIYVYDTADFPFYRGEQYHQFHANTVLRRTVPASYTRDLKTVQVAHGKINPTGCPDPGAVTGTPDPPPPPPSPPGPPAGLGGSYTGAMDVPGANPWDPAQHLTIRVQMQDGCTVGSVCGSVSYGGSGGGLPCSSTLTLVSQDRIVYNMRETVTTGRCTAEPSITVGRASGGLGFRTSRGSVLLAVAADAGSGAAAAPDLMVSGDDCDSAIQVFAGRLTSECCGAANPGVRCGADGIPSACSASCGTMWLPFATRCGDFLRAQMPQLTDFTNLCTGAGH